MPSNEKFLNQTGLAYYNTKVKGELDKKIEKIKVNGTEQTITNKEVDLEIPVVQFTPGEDKVSISNGINSIEFKTNGQNIDYDYNSTTTTLASKDYVDTNSGKIDKIKVNGTEQTITNKEVDLPVPNVTAGDKSITVNVPDNSKGFYLGQKSGGVEFGGTHTDGDFGTVILTDKNYVDTNFRTQQQVQDAIDAALAGVTGFEYQMVGELPETGEKGIIYLVSNSGSGENVFDEYIWIITPPTPTGDTGYFEKIGTTAVDLSGYWNDTNLVAITTAEIDALFA